MRADSTPNRTKQRFSPIYVIGFSQVIGVLAALVAVAHRIDVMVVPEEPLQRFEQIGAFVLAFVITFGGAGYVALQSGYDRPIARTIGGYAVYLATIGLAILALWLTGITWFIALPFLGLGLMLAIVMPPSTEARTLFRVAIPAFFGALLISFRGLSEVIWSIPTPDLDPHAHHCAVALTLGVTQERGERTVLASACRSRSRSDQGLSNNDGALDCANIGEANSLAMLRITIQDLIAIRSVHW